MLCSGDELGLTADADGILILAPETPLGAKLADLYGDVVLDVDVKPNRGDALSIVGIAREVAAVDRRPGRLPADRRRGGAARRSRSGSRSRSRTSGCARASSGRWIEGVDGRPVAGLGPDAAARGRHPARSATSSTPRTTSWSSSASRSTPSMPPRWRATRQGRASLAGPARRAAGERLATLDHVDRDARRRDAAHRRRRAGRSAIAGRHGRRRRRRCPTRRRDVIVESAIFDPVSIRRTAFRYALRSEASLRFEKGQEFRLARLGADRAARLDRRVGGRHASRAGAVDTQPDEPEPRRVAFRPARVDRLLGHGARRRRAARGARAGRHRDGAARRARSRSRSPAGDGAGVRHAPRRARRFVATVPTWRRDIEIEADLAEEVARVHGYERVPPRLPATPMPGWRETPLAARDAIREALVGAGPDRGRHATRSSRRGSIETFRVVVRGSRRRPARRRARARRSRSPTRCRWTTRSSASRSSAASSRSSTRTSRHGQADVAVFEVGKGYGRVGDASREWWRLGLALDRRRSSAPAWNRPRRDADLDDAKGVDRAHRAAARRERAGVRGRSPTSRSSTRAGARRVESRLAGRRASRSPASSASCTRASPRRGTSGRGGSIVAELSVAGPRRRQRCRSSTPSRCRASSRSSAT